MKPMFLFGNLK